MGKICVCTHKPRKILQPLGSSLGFWPAAIYQMFICLCRPLTSRRVRTMGILTPNALQVSACKYGGVKRRWMSRRPPRIS